jgi:hypothetical protein
MAAPLAPLARLAPMSLKMPENADARSLLETFGLPAKLQYFESGLKEIFFPTSAFDVNHYTSQQGE